MEKAKKKMTPKECVVLFNKLWNEGNIEDFDKTNAPNMVYHHGDRNMTTKEFADFSKEFAKGFPGNQYHIEDIIEDKERNICAVRYKWVGKHTGSFFGVPATNKEMSLIILEWDVFDEEGRFVESWARYDTLDWMKQMGLM